MERIFGLLIDLNYLSYQINKKIKAPLIAIENLL